MNADRPLPHVPDVGGSVADELAAFDAALEAALDDPVATLADSPYSTDLGVAMAAEARRVARGELASDEFWRAFDAAAAAEFGDDYRDTPNPAIDRPVEGRTIDPDVAADLQCAAGTMDDLVLAVEAESADGDGRRWGMVIDLQKCVGCDSCTVACKAENRTPPGVSYNVVMEAEHGEFPAVRRTNMPRPCLQCENPPCVQVCPVSATYKMANGIVNIDYDRCIGCRYCLIACPYGARSTDFGLDYADESLEDGLVQSPEYGVDRGPREGRASPVGNARKCSFCYHRLQRGEEPACVETCIGDARYFGDLNDPDSEVSALAASSRAFRLKEEEGTEPNLYYLR